MFTIKQGENEVLATVESEASSDDSARVLAKGFNAALAIGAESRAGKDEEVLLRNTSALPMGKKIIFNFTMPRQAVVDLIKRQLARDGRLPIGWHCSFTLLRSIKIKRKCKRGSKKILFKPRDHQYYEFRSTITKVFGSSNSVSQIRPASGRTNQRTRPAMKKCPTKNCAPRMRSSKSACASHRRRHDKEIVASEPRSADEYCRKLLVVRNQRGPTGMSISMGSLARLVLHQGENRRDAHRRR